MSEFINMRLTDTINKIKTPINGNPVKIDIVFTASNPSIIIKPIDNVQNRIAQRIRFHLAGSSVHYKFLVVVPANT